MMYLQWLLVFWFSQENISMYHKTTHLAPHHWVHNIGQPTLLLITKSRSGSTASNGANENMRLPPKWKCLKCISFVLCFLVHLFFIFIIIFFNGLFLLFDYLCRFIYFICFFIIYFNGFLLLFYYLCCFIYFIIFYILYYFYFIVFSQYVM